MTTESLGISARNSRLSTFKTAEDLADTWPVESNCSLIRWRRMLKSWREAEPALLLRHIHYEILYRDSHAIYAYEERRVLHIVWHVYETSFHPLCTQLMLTYGPSIKGIVKDAKDATNAGHESGG